jgi:hypothetical protein
MSRAGREAAAEHALGLPEFPSLEAAQVALFAERDRLLGLCSRLGQASNEFRCDFQPDSLKSLERWYFELVDRRGFSALGVSREEFERCIGVYLGEVLVRNSSSPFSWFVREFAFSPGRYELGVQRPKLAVMLSGPMVPEPLERNRRQESLWRRYKRYAA